MAEQLGKLSLQEQFDRLTKQKQALDTDDQGIDVSTSFLPSGEPLASDENTTNTVPAQQQVSGSDRPSWDGREQSKQQRESWDVLDQPEQLRSTTGAEQAHSRGHGGADQSLPDSSGRPSAGAVVPPLRLSSAGPADASCSISAPGLSAAGDLPGQQTCQASDEWTELSERYHQGAAVCLAAFVALPAAHLSSILVCSGRIWQWWAELCSWGVPR